MIYLSIYLTYIVPFQDNYSEVLLAQARSKRKVMMTMMMMVMMMMMMMMMMMTQKP